MYFLFCYITNLIRQVASSRSGGISSSDMAQSPQPFCKSNYKDEDLYDMVAARMFLANTVTRSLNAFYLTLEAPKALS